MNYDSFISLLLEPISFVKEIHTKLAKHGCRVLCQLLLLWFRDADRLRCHGSGAFA